MWLVCYELNGQTHFNSFESEEEARATYEADIEYYEREWGTEEFQISIAEVKEQYK